MINTVLMDLDGCLVNFAKGVMKAFNETEESLYPDWPPGQFEMEIPLMQSLDDFWKTIDSIPHFWESLEPMPDMEEILSTVEKHFDNIILCTSPPMSPEASAGKVTWIQEHLPKYARKFCITPCKELLAHSGALLIDDYDRNVDRFRGNGGNAILLPRRWNSNHQILSPKGWLELAIDLDDLARKG